MIIRIFVSKFTMAITFVLAIFFMQLSLFAFGLKETIPIGPIDSIDSINNDPLLGESIYRKTEEDKKRPLVYLSKLANANNFLALHNYLKSLQLFTELQSEYGDQKEIIFGLAESYFNLGDVTNAITYYLALITPDNDRNGGFEQEEITARYRLAELYFNQGVVDKFIMQLEYIISMSLETDNAIISVLKKESLDKVISLFIMQLDFSFIARRELGTYLAFKNLIEDKEAQQIITALAMAVHKVTNFLQIEQVGYEFTDLSYTIELLNATQQGKNLLQSYHFTRLLVVLRKFYLEQNTPKMTFQADYCTELLSLMGYTEDPKNQIIYFYYPIFGSK